MKYTQKFFQDIPIEKRKLVLDKIHSFETQLLQVKSFTHLPKGFWVRHIEGTDIYKFRVNNGDRVLFRYGTHDRDIIYIAYSNHDNQVRIARSTTKVQNNILEEGFINVQADAFEIDSTIYKENFEDDLLDAYMKNLYKDTYERIKRESLLEEEYIPLCIESKELEDKQFLTASQFSCLYGKKKPTIVMGCAGSGKTLVGLVKLKIDYQMGLRTIYMTTSSRMKKAAAKLCVWMEEDKKKEYFYTLEDLCWEILGSKPSTLISYHQFKEWLEEGKWQILKTLDKLDIWNEISSIIKGYTLEENKLISQDAYLLSEHSKYNKEQKGQLYVLAKAYQNWLQRNGYWDENDLIKTATKKVNKPIFEGIIVDEVQEMNACAIYFLSQIVRQSENVLLLGDQFQRLNVKYDNYDLLKQEIAKHLSLKSLNTNYRNTLGIINWNNQLKHLQHKEQFEEAVSSGKVPYYMVSKTIDNIFELANGDIESIIVVSNEEEREIIRKKGHRVGRVFTVEESRGLEYDRVYCYNLLRYTEREEKYNALYIAGSRAKKALFFIEEEPVSFIDKFEGYYEPILPKTLLGTFHKEEEIEKWIEEGKKLEAEEKYEQAIAAYEEAGEVRRAMLCKKAKEKQMSAIMLEERGQILDIYADYLDVIQIEKLLKQLYDKGSRLKVGWIELVMYHKADDLPTIKNIYLEQMVDFNYIARTVDACIKDIFSREHLTIKWVTEKRTGDNKITIHNEQIKIIRKNCSVWREEEEKRKQIRAEFIAMWGYPMRTHIQEIEDEEKISSKSTKEILDEIFS